MAQDLDQSEDSEGDSLSSQATSALFFAIGSQAEEVPDWEDDEVAFRITAFG